MIYVAHEPHPNSRLDTSLLDGEDWQPVFSASYSPTFSPKDAIAEARKALADFDPARDEIAWVGGDPLSIGIACTVATEICKAKGAPAYVWLKYERPKGDLPHRYVPVMVPA